VYKGEFRLATIPGMGVCICTIAAYLFHTKFGIRYHFSSEGISIKRTEDIPFCRWQDIHKTLFVVQRHNETALSISGLELHTKKKKIIIDTLRHRNLIECAKVIIPELEKHQTPCNVAIVKNFNVERKSITAQDQIFQQLKQFVNL